MKFKIDGHVFEATITPNGVASCRVIFTVDGIDLHPEYFDRMLALAKVGALTEIAATLRTLDGVTIAEALCSIDDGIGVAGMNQIGLVRAVERLERP